MKISMLIAHLQTIEENSGDMEVYVRDSTIMLPLWHNELAFEVLSGETGIVLVIKTANAVKAVA